VVYSAKHEKWRLDKLKYIEVEEEIAVEVDPEVPEEEIVNRAANINLDSKFKKL
jgi:hypothetical protein